MQNNLSILLTEAKPPTKSPSNSLLRAVPAQALALLLPYLEEINLTADEKLYLTGEVIEYLYFPETAIVSEFRLLEDGKTTETVMLGSQDAVGLSAVLSQARAGSGTVVLVAGSAVRVKADIFRRAFSQSDELQRQLLTYLNRHTEQISKNILCQMHHSVEERFCRWLLMLAGKSGTTQFLFTQERIAKSLGIHRPSLSAVAIKLQRRGLIEYNRGKLLILNIQGLEEAGCECCP